MMIFFSHIHSRMQESPMVTHRESPFTFLVSSHMVFSSMLNLNRHSLLSLSQSYSSAPDGSNKNQSSTPKVKILRQVDQRQPKAQAHFQARVKAMKQVCGSLKLELAVRLCLYIYKYPKIFLFFKLIVCGLIMVRTGFIIYDNISALFASLPTCHMMAGAGSSGRFGHQLRMDIPPRKWEWEQL